MDPGYNDVGIAIPDDQIQETHRDDNNNTHICLENDWIVVIYDGKWYPGRVESVASDKRLRTKFMHFLKKLFFWPEQEDVQMIHPLQISRWNISQMKSNLKLPIEKISKNFFASP